MQSHTYIINYNSVLNAGEEANAIQNSMKTNKPASTKLVVSTATGGVATVGLIGLVVGTVFFLKRRRRRYKKISLLSVE